MRLYYISCEYTASKNTTHYLCDLNCVVLSVYLVLAYSGNKYLCIFYRYNVLRMILISGWINWMMNEEHMYAREIIRCSAAWSSIITYYSNVFKTCRYSQGRIIWYCIVLNISTFVLRL